MGSLSSLSSGRNTPLAQDISGVNSGQQTDDEDEDFGLPVVELSLCGLSNAASTEQLAVNFNRCRVDFARFSHEPEVLEHPDLVVRIAGEQYLTWKVRGGLFVCFVA